MPTCPLAVLQVLVGGFVYMILYSVGFFLLLVPGLFVLVRFPFVPMYIVDEWKQDGVSFGDGDIARLEPSVDSSVLDRFAV